MSRRGGAGRPGTWPFSSAWRLGLALALASPAGLAGSEPRPSAEELPEPGTTLERRLESGEIHRYRYALTTGEELWLSVFQEGVDLVLTVLGADGEPRLAVDTPGGAWGEEWLLIGSAAPREATVEIRSLSPASPPGAYRLHVATRGRATSADPRRRAAERRVTEAGGLIREGSRQARREALALYRQAHLDWRELGHEAEATRVLFLLGMLERQLGQVAEGLALLRRAHAGWQLLGDRRGEAQAAMESAIALYQLGRGDEVEELLELARRRWRDLGDPRGEVLTLVYLGLSRARQEPRSSLEPYRRALELCRRLGDPIQEGVVLNNLGGVYDLLGEPHPALEYLRLALEVQERLNDLGQQAAVWNNMASIHRRTGRLQDALDGYGRALAAYRELGDPRREGRLLNNLGLTWLRLGDPRRASDFWRQALVLRRESEDRRGEAITLYNLGLAQAELEQWSAAEAFFQQALEGRRELGDRSGEAASRVALGRVLGRKKQPAAARQNLRAALELLEESGNTWRQAQAWWALGEISTLSGAPGEAVAALERATALYAATGDESRRGEVLLALARAERDLALRGAGLPLAPVYERAAAALELLEAVRIEVDGLGSRASFLSRHEEAYEFTVALAMELHEREPEAGWAARALEISERSRARSLLDLLREAGAGPRRGVDADLLERQQELLERLRAKVDRRRRHLEHRGPATAIERLGRETRQIQAELEEVENEIRRQSPGRAALVDPRPLAADAVRQLLDPHTLLLEFALGEEESFAFAVSADRVASFALPGRRVIEEAAREVYDGWRVHDPRDGRHDAAAAARASEILLAPLAGLLDRQRLVIVADGALHFLPFAALPHPRAPGEPLLARHEISLAPSASALAVQRQTLSGREPAAKALAVLADPVFDAADPRLAEAGTSAAPTPSTPAPPTATPSTSVSSHRAAELGLSRLSWSRVEADSILAHAGADQSLAALGFDADLDLVRRGGLRGYRVVHFATHGILDSEVPELSALVLSLYDAAGRSREGFLRLPEIYNLELDADLVVLSGCETALGREIRGEGLVGLTRGFFAAGARRLVASLWRVQDRTAAVLMDRLYRRLLDGDGDGDGDSDGDGDGEGAPRPAAALREAQLELLREPEFADPYHWAAFAVYGDP